MSGNWITVAEAARLTGRSAPTIRRWCRDSRLTGTKAGRDWLIDENSIPSPSSRRRARGGSTPLDLPRALTHIRKHDLKRDTWTPDCLRFADHLAVSDALIQSAAQSIATGYTPDRLTHIRVPKSEILSRMGSQPSLADRIIYQALIASFTPQLDALLSDGVLSARLEVEDTGYFLKKSDRLYSQFQARTSEAVEEGYNHLVVADVVAYFDHIDHRLLFTQIAELRPSELAVAILGEQLRTWNRDNNVGIPQGPNASRVLGNLYLAPVDSALLTSGLDIRLLRFQDDIRILARSRGDAVRAAQILEGELAARKLTPAADKSRILVGDEIDDLLGDPRKDQITYEIDAGLIDVPRKRLRKMLDSALRKAQRRQKPSWPDVKFALWRLARLRDSARLRQVLALLDRLAPEASIVAAYIHPWIDRQDVQTALGEYLLDDDRNLFEYAAIWLLTPLLEASSVTAEIQQYVRSIAHDRNAHSELRIAAANVLGRHGTATDRDWLTQACLDEPNTSVARGFCVAVRRFGQITRPFATAVSRRHPNLAATVDYLRSRQSLPSLVYPDRAVAVPD